MPVVKALWSTLKELLELLPGDARAFLIRYSVSSSALALIDILALGLLALMMAPLASNQPVRLPIIGVVPPDNVIWVLAGACALMVLKSLIALAQQWYVTRRMAHFELAIGDRLFSAYIRAPWLERMKRNSAELVRMADVGIANTTSGLLLPVASLPSQVVTFFSVLVVLFVAQPMIAVATIVYLGIVAALLYGWVSRRAVKNGRMNRDFSFRTATLMTEMVQALKEITLRDKASEVAALVNQNRAVAVKARATIGFLGAIPKFVIDSAVIIGFLIIGGVGFLTGGLSGAFSSIALFGIASFRMVPSMLQFQGVMTSTASTLPHARAVIRDIKAAEGYIRKAEVIGDGALQEHPVELVFEDVAFTYPGSDEPALRDVNLRIPLGSHIAFVGASGAGKSTMVDLILGLLTTRSGRIRLDDTDLADVLGAWRRRVGYVPQDVALFDGTVGQNIALTWSEEYDRDAAWRAANGAQLDSVVRARAGELDAQIGERGLALSGGQRQRLGIARALYTDPVVLVMDEATSALDTQTEDAVTSAIRELRGAVTVITVAHRLATVRDADIVCFFAGGRIVAQGTFDEVVAAEPEFAAQARLAGLA
ncbi:ATP-binding cassette subfamily C protein [Microbacterium phyllosphaerae]|uniref:ATP-binding cassette subfamily C protein n=1 Tax=Microbacterium phyllosphaerae TaxID=124798 RepID=A0ABS4WQF5_9MICO|nr:ABC transporter ATP-binding protein [Microbacterium phyllosphaerae]MBP2378281.1 ATP-binding cassette subfamily C protein [Microbacterium phyllosphaerae]